MWALVLGCVVGGLECWLVISCDLWVVGEHGLAGGYYVFGVVAINLVSGCFQVVDGPFCGGFCVSRGRVAEVDGARVGVFVVVESFELSDSRGLFESFELSGCWSLFEALKLGCCGSGFDSGCGLYGWCAFDSRNGSEFGVEIGNF